MNKSTRAYFTKRIATLDDAVIKQREAMKLTFGTLEWDSQNIHLHWLTGRLDEAEMAMSMLDRYTEHE